MPLHLSSFAWWTWLLLSVAFNLLAGMFIRIAKSARDGAAILALLMFASVFTGIGCFVIAMIRLVQLVWH